MPCQIDFTLYAQSYESALCCKIQHTSTTSYATQREIQVKKFWSTLQYESQRKVGSAMLHSAELTCNCKYLSEIDTKFKNILG
jgi:hypothetical protein